MSRWFSYLHSAAAILSLYKGDEPFASFIKKYFSRHKKYGGKDRKQISHLCYCYFRLGKALVDISIEEKIIFGLFLCSTQSNELIGQLNPALNEKADLPWSEKLASIPAAHISQVFPWKEKMSEGIDYDKWIESFFIQPNTFLRLRPGKEQQVKQKLTAAGIPFQIVEADCLSLAAATKLDDVIATNKEAVIQDHSSQRVGEFIEIVERKFVRPGRSDKFRVWDCCAASGGKSIMAIDILKNMELEVSDVRESILINLKKRFAEAGITKYKSFVADLSKPFINSLAPVDLLIADVPCTGSGTWSRTPEQLFYFNEEKINEYAALQKKIMGNAIKYINPGGYLLYITCSVFKKENEEMIHHLQQQMTSLQLIKMETITGYDRKADTLFAALLQKTL